jgi:multidrug efflux pump subunit AcrA (membrane-fusion protein)
MGKAFVKGTSICRGCIQVETDTKLQDDEVQGRDADRARNNRKRSPLKSWSGALIVMAVICGGWWFYQHLEGKVASANARPAGPPEVTVSKPLVENLATRLGFLGQFSAVDQVELRAQVGGTLTGIYFKDGDIVHKGDLLFTIDPVPYEIKLAQAKALLESATTCRSLSIPDITHRVPPGHERRQRPDTVEPDSKSRARRHETKSAQGTCQSGVLQYPGNQGL